MVCINIALNIEPYRRETFPLLKPYFNKKGEPKGSLEAQNKGGYRFVDDLNAADFIVLPMSWNFYLKNNQLPQVLQVVQQAKEKNVPVLSFQTGDYGVKIPEMEGVIVLRANGHRSRLPQYHVGLPPFIEDPIAMHFEGHWEPAAYTHRPKIGFCGMANTSYAYALEELKRILLRNFNFYLGGTKNLPQQVLPTTFRRAQLLEKMRTHEALETHFIYRKRYQAGAQTDEDRKRVAEEFYTNIWENHYVLCFRGAGNFSVRLYETLAMGRIPIFVNTDCILPLANDLPWKKHVVWIEYDERHTINSKVLDFHQSHSPESFMKLQEDNRSLWREKLTIEGFFNQFFLTIK